MKYKNTEHFNIYYENSCEQTSYEKLTQEQYNNYVNKLGLCESHKSLIQLMKLIHEICVRNRINYSISDGTLLGAFRHADFVPWDDDADVMFTREEHDKFIEACKKEPNICIFKYFFLDKFSTKDLFPKSISIDLCVCDTIPNNRMQFEYQKRRLRYMRFYLYPQLILNQNSLRKKICFFFSFLAGKLYGTIIGHKNIDARFDKIAREGENDPSESYFRSTSSVHELNYCFDRTWFNSYKSILFHGEQFMMIEGAEEFLKNMYGDYKKLPPEEKRIITHGMDYTKKGKYIRFVIKNFD